MPRPILYPYQRRWLDDPARFKIGMFSRQSGKTYTTTLEIAEDIIRAELEKRRVRWVILSRGERQAREAMDEGLKVHLRAFGAAFDAFETDFRLSDATSCKSLEVTMKHGSRVTALPANADTARGFSANVFLDEFAFHQDSRKIWAALFPVISRPGDVVPDLPCSGHGQPSRNRARYSRASFPISSRSDWDRSPAMSMPRQTSGAFSST